MSKASQLKFDVLDNLALSFKNCKFQSFFVLNWAQTTIYELIMYGKNMFYVCFPKINLQLFVCLLLVGFYPTPKLRKLFVRNIDLLAR